MAGSSPSAGGGGGEAETVPSTSTIVAEMATGSHVLTIDGYSGTKGLAVGEHVKSGTFFAGGHSWHIKYFPNGATNETSEWVSVFVCLGKSDKAKKDAAVTVKARCKLTLLDGRDGKPPLPPPLTKSSELRTFSSGKGGSDQWGHKKFVRRKELEDLSKRLLRHDRFSVRCDVTVAVGIRTDATAKLPAPPPSDLHRHLGRLLKTKAGADVTFDVAGQKFAAHRCVLAARSPVFMAELLGPMKEKDTASHVVSIRDMDSRAFKAMLHFIYTDSLPKLDDDGGEAVTMAQHLLAAADRYDIERLKLICEDKLRGHVDASTAATTLSLAEQHGCRRLKEACIKFIASPGNLKAVMASDGFDHLARSCSSLLKEIAANLAVQLIKRYKLRLSVRL